MASERRTTSIHIEDHRVDDGSQSHSEDERDDRRESQQRRRPSAPARTNTNTSLVRTRPPSPTRPASAAPEKRRLFKRLIVCCDGTWLDSNSGAEKKPDPPSNVTRLARAINSYSRDGISQIVFYQNGVGSTGTAGNKIIGGATGDGLAGNVREAYSFLSYNYVEGDEIFLIGFSRGAFTARSIGGLIGHMGILTKAGVGSLPVIYKDFAHRYDGSYRTPQRDVPFPNKPPADSPEYPRELQRRGLTVLGVRIRAIACFDTVGSLGVPRFSWLSGLTQKMDDQAHEYRFYDTTLDECIDNAFQALALDERRAPFSPSLWEKRRNRRTNLIQCWFCGVHANCGGGYPDQELANITLAWMMAMLEPLLELDLEYIHDEEKLNADYYEHKGQKPRPWSFGKIYNSSSGIYSVAGSKTRTPGFYTRIDPRNGEATNKLLRETCEYIHLSVRTRTVLDGPSAGGRGSYRSAALKGWELRSEPNVSLPTPWYWESTGRDAIILPEAPMRPIERALLKSSPDVYDYAVEPPPAPNRRSRNG